MKDPKPTGRAWAFLASAWRKYTSYDETSAQLIDSLKEKGYLTAEYNNGKQPTTYPSRKQVLAARGLPEEINFND